MKTIILILTLFTMTIITNCGEPEKDILPGPIEMGEQFFAPNAWEMLENHSFRLIEPVGIPHWQDVITDLSGQYTFKILITEGFNDGIINATANSIILTGTMNQIYDIDFENVSPAESERVKSNYNSHLSYTSAEQKDSISKWSSSTRLVELTLESSGNYKVHIRKTD